MSLVHKIPPLVSAIAFGYGVGMAAPDATISSVHDAVLRPKAEVVQAAASPKPVSPLLPASLGRTAPGVGGEESRLLGKLRAAQRDDDKRGASCEVDPPRFSRAPRYETTRDGMQADADDLDQAGSEALSKLQLPDLKVPITRRVLKYVKFFTRSEGGRGMFETWLRRSGRYQDLVQRELREWRMPEDLIWVAMIESGFDPRAKSPVGAVGLWQFMPATGAVYGLEQNRFLDQRKNPRLATQAAVHHLRDLYMRFGSWDLALAAYNMGYEQLLSAIDQHGTADFNELARQEAIPSETAAYVPKIIAAAVVSNNLEHFGFDHVELARPVDSAELAMPGGTPLRTIAKAAGVSTATLRALNPDFLTERVPAGRGDYLTLVPADTVARTRAALPALLENEPIVTSDAQALDSVDQPTGRDLARRKSKSDDQSLLSLLPPPHHRSLRDPISAFQDDDAIEVDEPLEDVSRHHAKKKRQTVLYRVEAGDTMVSIARHFAMDVEDVARLNHLDVSDKPKVGGMLKLKVRPEMMEGADATSEKVDRDAPTGHATSDGDKKDDAKHDAAHGKDKPAKHKKH
jgi:membrane-bound lytic murein transglycosylase D